MDLIEYKVEHPLVESCWSEEFKSGIIVINFNLVDKEVDCHQYNNNLYEFSKVNDLYDWLTLEDSEHLIKIDAGWYQTAISQDDNQVQYIFIPLYMMMSSKMWIKTCELKMKNYNEQLDLTLKMINTTTDNLLFWKRDLKKLEYKKQFYGIEI